MGDQRMAYIRWLNVTVPSPLLKVRSYSRRDKIRAKLNETLFVTDERNHYNKIYGAQRVRRVRRASPLKLRRVAEVGSGT